MVAVGAVDVGVVVVGIVDVVVVDVVDVAVVDAGTVVLGPIDVSIVAVTSRTSDMLEPGIKGTPPREVVIEISISRLRVWMAGFSGQVGR